MASTVLHILIGALSCLIGLDVVHSSDVLESISISSGGVIVQDSGADGSSGKDTPVSRLMLSSRQAGHAKIKNRDDIAMSIDSDGGTSDVFAEISTDGGVRNVLSGRAATVRQHDHSLTLKNAVFDELRKSLLEPPAIVPNSSSYLVVFLYPEHHSGALWKLANLLGSIGSSSADNGADIFVLTDWNASDLYQSLPGHDEHQRIHVVSLARAQQFLTSMGVRKPHEMDPTFWKIIFANFALQELGMQSLLVVDCDVVCNKNTRKPLEIYTKVFRWMPPDSGIACSLEDPEEAKESNRHFNTGFCAFRHLPKTLSFLNELTPLMFKIHDDDETPFNMLSVRLKAESDGFITTVPQEIIQTTEKFTGTAICYHYTGLSHFRKSWARFQNG